MARNSPLRADLTGFAQLTEPRGGVLNVRSSFGRVGRALRNLPDKLTRKRRYLDATRRLSRMNRPRTILIVCHANICRSPYLEGVLKLALPDVTVASAGIAGAGRPVPPFSLAVGAARGIDLSGFRSRPLVPATARDADLVLVMEARQARYVATFMGIPPSRIIVAGDLDPKPSETRAIRDPWGQPIAAYITAFDRLDRCAATLVSHLRRAR